MGGVTYLGSPLQLSWADLYDEQRGVLLLNPETLEHEMLINPHGVGYTTANLQQVLDGQVDQSAVMDKHVMLLGDLTRYKYVTARDKLLSLGVRSVRNWTPIGLALNADKGIFRGFGASVPASDAAIQPLQEPKQDEAAVETTKDVALASETQNDSGPEPQPKKLDLISAVQEYVDSLDLDESLVSRRDELIRIGQRVIQASHHRTDQDTDGEINHKDFLDKSYRPVGTGSTAELAKSETHIFVAEPRKLTITNFLGVQGTITLDFHQDVPRGLTFLVGDNGSGKSTLVEAMVWCQFGRSLRAGLAANDVINDNEGKNCSVVLEFANGYSITRYRKHKVEGNRVIVSLHGEPQLQLEHPDARTTQAAINELLGTDYETYVRTVVLGHESAVSFLSMSVAQRRDLIGASLGLSILDQCAQVSRLLLKHVDNDVERLNSQLNGLLGTIKYMEGKLEDLAQAQNRFESESQEAVLSLETAVEERKVLESKIVQESDTEESQTCTGQRCQEPHGLHEGSQSAIDVRSDLVTLQNRVYIEEENLRRLGEFVSRLQEKPAGEAIWLAQARLALDEKLKRLADARATGLFHAVKLITIRFQAAAFGGLMRVYGMLKRSFRRVEFQPNQETINIHVARQDLEKSALRLRNLEKETDVMIAQEQSAMDRSAAIKEQFAQLIQAQSACEALQQQVSLKQRDVDTYRHLITTEQSSLASLRLEQDALTRKIEEIATDRELFAFWSSSMARRTRRVSSSAKSTARASASFHDLVLGKSLSELNTLLAQVLTALYDDTRHTRVVAAGMLRSLFETESIDESMTNDEASSGAVLDGSLAVHHSLAYGKRSGGERKRVDLALFFALLQLSWARSAHRARYLLVDEVFDSLDEAGQAAVVRLCGILSQTVADWIVVITHSRYLIERDPEEQGQYSVVRAQMGERGVLYKTNSDV
ncbi:P-loop containing nucleoside triphosphate hydrolase protein [Stachybotrys elegans]|uniref:P-loop containing nucleoside triphosphate hydrolase protein n=1 Tax=Stachybotrys elegans TaxID=80388 RepID=A0A8K0SFD4_9HYPO|nr:P-loop containing nucleoside triphosphate hydrolase protein [Stachybotrys elegans]